MELYTCDFCFSSNNFLLLKQVGLGSLACTYLFAYFLASSVPDKLKFLGLAGRAPKVYSSTVIIIFSTVISCIFFSVNQEYPIRAVKNQHILTPSLMGVRC